MSLKDVAKLLFEFPGKKGLYKISTGDLANSGAFLAQAILFPIMNKTGESAVGESFMFLFSAKARLAGDRKNN